MTIDYKIRGFTRDIYGHKLFIDHEISSIQNYIPDEAKELFDMIDVNVYKENIFHTKCKLKQFDLDNYLFGYTKDKLSEAGEEITERIKLEMDEIYYGKTWTAVTDGMHSDTLPPNVFNAGNMQNQKSGRAHKSRA